MTTEIAVAVISFVGVLVTAMCGLVLGLISRTNRHAKSAADDAAVLKTELKNSHTGNYREENDAQHREVMTTLDKHGRGISKLRARAARTDLAIEALAKRLPPLEEPEDKKELW